MSTKEEVFRACVSLCTVSLWPVCVLQAARRLLGPGSQLAAPAGGNFWGGEPERGRGANHRPPRPFPLANHFAAIPTLNVIGSRPWQAAYSAVGVPVQRAASAEAAGVSPENKEEGALGRPNPNSIRTPSDAFLLLLRRQARLCGDALGWASPLLAHWWRIGQDSNGARLQLASFSEMMGSFCSSSTRP